MDSVRLGVRKGAWTEEEDLLLRKCIEKYGEGKWWQVPLRAGLNRCRKSCRRRWLNYLRPNLKKGNFMLDEADLIIRLHKLLGNRWSLIAGRLPGRTANDVKNYWNTQLHKRLIAQEEEEEKEKAQNAMKHKIVRPQPWSFTKNLLLQLGKSTIKIDNTKKEDNLTKAWPTSSLGDDIGTSWWDNTLDTIEITNEIKWSLGGSAEEPMAVVRPEEVTPKILAAGESSVQGGQSDWSTENFIDNVILWGLFNDEQAVI